MGTIADKLNLLLNTKSAIKNAIIAKGQAVADTDPFSAYADKIAAIQTGVTLPTLTSPGTAADLLSGKQLIDGDGNVVNGSMAAATQATPSISVSSSGLITASATQTAGYVAAGTKSATSQVTAWSSNLIASNIKSGVNIFGVIGTLESGEVEPTYLSLTTADAISAYSVDASNRVMNMTISMGVVAQKVTSLNVYLTSISDTALDCAINYPALESLAGATFGLIHCVSSSGRYRQYRLDNFELSSDGTSITIGTSNGVVNYMPVSRDDIDTCYIDIFYIPA